MPLYLCQQGSMILYGVTDETQFADYLEKQFHIGQVDPNNVNEINRLISTEWDGDYKVKIVEI